MFTFINEIFIIHVTSEISESWNFFNFFGISNRQFAWIRNFDLWIWILAVSKLLSKSDSWLIWTGNTDVDGILILVTQCWWQNRDFGDRNALKSTSKQLNKLFLSPTSVTNMDPSESVDYSWWKASSAGTVRKNRNHMMRKSWNRRFKSGMIQFVLSRAIIWTLGLSKIPDVETVKRN